ncbi:MAG: DUF4197 family protein, partial [Flavobacteriales bacterium]
QSTSGQVTREFDGKLVRVPGYLVPLSYDGTGVTAALLVPYVGACIHVPPPPPNQLIYVTIEDAFGILNGGDTAASDFLKRKTSAELTASFTPKVSDAINKVELTKHWEPLVSKYNLSTLLTGKEPINEDLTAYITEKAIDGLFVHITAEEKLIRKDPKARATDLLERVFGSIQP